MSSRSRLLSFDFDPAVYASMKAELNSLPPFAPLQQRLQQLLLSCAALYGKFPIQNNPLASKRLSALPVVNSSIRRSFQQREFYTRAFIAAQSALQVKTEDFHGRHPSPARLDTFKRVHVRGRVSRRFAVSSLLRDCSALLRCLYMDACSERCE